MKVISPSIGRKVWFYPINDHAIVVFNPEVACDATVIYPWSDNCVNLRITDHTGITHIRTSVYLVQPGTPAPASNHCTWMPFQVGQSTKESGATAGDTNPTADKAT